MFTAIINLLSSPWTVILTLVLGFLTYDFLKRRGLPPGPYGLPFFGWMFSVDREIFSQQAGELSVKYNSEVVSISLPGKPLIFINSYDLMRECFQKRTDLIDREAYPLIRAFDERFTGLINTAGGQWREVRRFSISMLRDFGMGRVGAEENIQDECDVLANILRDHNGKAFNPRSHINAAVANIICGMVFGRRFRHDDDKFTAALKGINDLLSKFVKVSVILSLRYKFLRDYVITDYYRRMSADYAKFSGFVKDRIEEHREAYNGEVTDLIHGFLKEMENGREYFDEQMLQSLIVDLFLAGTETTSTTLCWGLLVMAAHPEMQTKVHQELKDMIGERRVSMSDKKNTPYTEAVICEIQRHFTLAPFGVPHGNLSENVDINGYTVPKGCAVFGNIGYIHHDQKYWKNPDEFNPERFLLNGKVEHWEHLVPFGIGRRSCAGEALAKMELYIFFASLMKDFEVKPETDETIPDLEGRVTGLAVFEPNPFKVRVFPRV